MNSYNPEKRRMAWEKAKERMTPEQHLARRLYMIAYDHSMTSEQLLGIWDQQAGRCKACSSPLDLETPRAFNVDHDVRCCSYELGRRGNPRTKRRISCGRCVRGILCAPCNRAVGLMERYEERVHAWMDYIRAAGRAS